MRTEGFVDTIPYSLTGDIKELEPFEVDTDFIFICDLHLAAGIDPVSGGMHLREEFLHDQVFSRWLEHCIKQTAAGGSQAILVLLGDSFDLLRVEPLEGRSGSPEAAASKLDRIASGHPVFFAALRTFLSKNGRIVILPGNHDIKLVYLPVQTRLRTLLAPAGGQPAPTRVEFYPWIFHLPGIFYAEHGQQHHEINAFPEILHMAERKNIPQPPGAVLDAYFYRLGQQAGLTDPAPAVGAVLKALIRKPGRLFLGAPGLLRFFGSFFMAFHTGEAGINRMNGSAFAAQSAVTGLSPISLGAIDRMASRSFRKWVGRLISTKKPTGRKSNGYLFEAAERIHRLLIESGEQTRFYVFGHDHRAQLTRLTSGDNPAWYVNGGSWTARQAGTNGSTSNPTFTFARIQTGRHNDNPHAQLLLWDDESGGFTILAET